MISAPANAATGRISNGSFSPLAASSRSPTTMVTAAASPAPADTPTSPGSASGLRNRPCMTVPAAASSAPTMHGRGDARQPDRPQHQPVARDRAGRRVGKAERRHQAAERDAGRADRRGDHRHATTSAASRMPITIMGERRKARGRAARAPHRLRSSPAGLGRVVLFRRHHVAGDDLARAPPRDRGRRAPCADRSRADRGFPSIRRHCCDAAGVSAKRGMREHLGCRQRLMRAAASPGSHPAWPRPAPRRRPACSRHTR